MEVVNGQVFQYGGFVYTFCEDETNTVPPPCMVPVAKRVNPVDLTKEDQAVGIDRRPSFNGASGDALLNIGDLSLPTGNRSHTTSIDNRRTVSMDGDDELHTAYHAFRD